MAPLLLGMKWMDPNWLLENFGTEFFWISLLIIFVECGLFFPFLPGDTLLFALGLFIAGGKIALFPGGEGVELLIASVLLILAAIAGNVAGYEIGRAIGPRSTSATAGSSSASTSTRPRRSSTSTATRRW